MDFYEILDQVIALLQQRGKASYRALKLQFKLDDASLDVLKDELIKVHQLARDHDGEMLVWTGETATAQAVASQTAQPTLQPAVQEQQSPQVAPLPTVPPPPDAERRQLTVMFCDLVESTKSQNITVSCRRSASGGGEAVMRGVTCWEGCCWAASGCVA